MNITRLQFAIIMLLSATAAWAEDRCITDPWVECISRLTSKDSVIWVTDGNQAIVLQGDGKYQYSTQPKVNGGTWGMVSTGTWSVKDGRTILVGDWGPMNGVQLLTKRRFTVNITPLKAIEGKQYQYKAWIYFDEITVIN